MGHISSAVCHGCGYEARAVIGNSRANFRTVATFPVSCNVCKAVTSANFMKTPLTCDRCAKPDVVPFTDTSVWKGDGIPDEQWGDLTLTDGHYKCPKCSKFELRFGRASGKGIGMFFD
jgi:hypothetical protein